MGAVNETLGTAPHELRRVLAELVDERGRQDEKFGEQNHPHADQVILERLSVGGQYGNPVAVAGRLAQFYEIPTAARAKSICRAEAAAGAPTWIGIALEELAEVLEATTEGDPAKLRTEWLQLAAVCVAAVQCIDRHGGSEQ